MNRRLLILVDVPAEASVEPIPAAVSEEPIFEFEDSGFERVIDDGETGEMFKDAYLQEAIVDKVRAIEFDMESTGEVKVGSLLDEVVGAPTGFQRIADEDEETAPEKPAKGRGAKRKPKQQDRHTDTKKNNQARKPAAKCARSKKRSKAKDNSDDSSSLTAKPARVEKSDTSAMAVRRGGRGRRRGGRGRSNRPPAVKSEERFETSAEGDAGFQES